MRITLAYKKLLNYSSSRSSFVVSTFYVIDRMITQLCWYIENENEIDNENRFITIDLHVYKIQGARYQNTENKHQTLFFLW